MSGRTVSIRIDSVPPAAITDALIAIERARTQGVYDNEQITRLTPLVEGLRRTQAAAGAQTELFPEATRQTDPRPTHVIRLGSDRSLCGLRTNSPDCLPQIGEPFADRHIASYGMNVCPTCDQHRRKEEPK